MKELVRIKCNCVIDLALYDGATVDEAMCGINLEMVGADAIVEDFKWGEITVTHLKDGEED